VALASHEILIARSDRVRGDWGKEGGIIIDKRTKTNHTGPACEAPDGRNAQSVEQTQKYIGVLGGDEIKDRLY
jgi:hypothetical protein